MSDYLSTIARVGQQQRAQAEQRQQQQAATRQWESPLHRTEFLAWAQKQYKDYDWRRYLTGASKNYTNTKTALPDPKDVFWSAKNQFDYNMRRVAGGQKPITFKDAAYDPSQYDDDYNDQVGAYTKAFGVHPSDTKQFNSWRTTQTYKDQYTNTIEDERNKAQGLPPLSVQRAQSAAQEMETAKQRAQQLGPNATRQDIVDLFNTFPTLRGYQAYADKQAYDDEQRKAKAAEGGTPIFDVGDLFGTKKSAALPYDEKALSALGYDKLRGFGGVIDDLYSAMVGQRSADNAAQITQGWKDAMAQRAPARPAQTIQPVVQPTQPVPHSANDPLTIAGGLGQLRGNGSQAAQQAADMAAQQAAPKSLYQRIDEALVPVSQVTGRVLNAPQALYLNAWNALTDLMAGRTPQYNADMSGAQYAADAVEKAGASDASNIPAALQSIYTNPQTRAATAKALGLPEDSGAADVVSNLQGAIAQMPYEAATGPTTMLGAGELAYLSRGGRPLQIGDAGYEAYLQAGKLTPKTGAGALDELNAMEAEQAAAATAQQAGRADEIAQAVANRQAVPPPGPKPIPNAGQAWGQMPQPRALPKPAGAQPQSAAVSVQSGPMPKPSNTTTNAVQAARSADNAATAGAANATSRTVAQSADNVAEMTIDPKSGKPLPVGKPGQKAFDIEVEPPEGMKERGYNRNTRTDANNPDALRQAASSDPLFYEQVHDKDTLAKAQKIYDQGEAAARSELNRLNEKMAPEAVPLAKMLARDAAARGDVATARQIMSDAAERLTSAGQYTSAARILREADPETMFMTMDKQLKKLNTEGQKIYGKRWSDFDLTPEEIDDIQKLTPGDTGAYEAVMEKIQARVADQLPSTAMEKLTAWRHMAMLLNPKTHIRNMAGNTLMLGLNKAAEKVDAVLQRVILPKDLRTQSVRVSREARQTAKDFFVKNEKDLMQKASKYDEGLGLNMHNKRVFKNNVLESVRKFNYDKLQQEDKIFYRKAFADRLASAMQVKGVTTADGITDDMVRLAKTEAEKATFQDANAFYEAIAKLKKSKGGAFVDTVMPFAKTPINITMRGIDYSPVGAFKGALKLLLKKETAAQGISDIAKGLTGTGAMAAGYFLADAGFLTGAQDKDKDKANYDKATGTSAFQIVPLGITYDWAQPAAIPLAVGVAIHDAIQDDPRAQAKLRKAIESGDTETMKQLAGAFGTALFSGMSAGVDTIYNMSVMQGVSDLFGDPAGFGAALAKLPANYASQMIPTVSGQLAGAIDPTVRKTNYGTNPLTDLEGYAKTAGSTLVAKIPGASSLLEPKVTPFGENQTRDTNPWTRTLQQFVNPGNTTAKQAVDPQVDTELRRLFDAGQVKQFPITVDKNFTFMDKQIRLTDSEYTKYQRVTGKETMQAMKDIINAPEYRAMPTKDMNAKLKELAGKRGTDVAAQRNDETIKRLTDEYRAALLAKAIVYGRSMAQMQILQERGVLGTPTAKELAKRLPSISEADAKKLLNK